MTPVPHVELKKTAKAFSFSGVIVGFALVGVALYTSSAIVASMAGIWLSLIAPIRDSMRCLAAIQRDLSHRGEVADV